MSEYIVIGTIIAAFAVAAVLSYFFTPPVKNFAHKVGAIDVPKDARRMHKKPIPRLGGLAIYGDGTYEDKWYLTSESAGAFRHNAQTSCAARLCRACAE